MIVKPLVSVITPSYNQGHYIKATIESVLGQDYENIEYIVIDGDSTDDTLQILRSFRDPRLTWVSEKDRGQSEAINKGLRRASGELLTYLNSDDLLLPGCISTIVELFGSSPNTDLIFGDCQFIDLNGKVVRIVNGAPFDITKMIMGTQILPQPGTFWRRRVIEKVGYIDELLHFTMDSEYWLRIATAGLTLEYVSGTRAAFRIHEQSKTTSQRVKFWDDWEYMLTKIYANSVPAELESVRNRAFEGVEWTRLKHQWLHSHYDLTKLRFFLRGSSLKIRTIAVLMLLEAYTHLPLFRMIYGPYVARKSY